MPKAVRRRGWAGSRAHTTAAPALRFAALWQRRQSCLAAQLRSRLCRPATPTDQHDQAAGKGPIPSRPATAPRGQGAGGGAGVGLLARRPSARPTISARACKQRGVAQRPLRRQLVPGGALDWGPPAGCLRGFPSAIRHGIGLAPSARSTWIARAVPPRSRPPEQGTLRRRPSNAYPLPLPLISLLYPADALRAAGKRDEPPAVPGHGPVGRRGQAAGRGAARCAGHPCQRQQRPLPARQQPTQVGAASGRCSPPTNRRPGGPPIRQELTPACNRAPCPRRKHKRKAAPQRAALDGVPSAATDDSGTESELESRASKERRGSASPDPVMSSASAAARAQRPQRAAAALVAQHPLAPAPMAPEDLAAVFEQPAAPAAPPAWLAAAAAPGAPKVCVQCGTSESRGSTRAGGSEWVAHGSTPFAGPCARVNTCTACLPTLAARSHCIPTLTSPASAPLLPQPPPPCGARSTASPTATPTVRRPPSGPALCTCAACTCQRMQAACVRAAEAACAASPAHRSACCRAVFVSMRPVGNPRVHDSPHPSPCPPPPRRPAPEAQAGPALMRRARIRPARRPPRPLAGPINPTGGGP